MSHLNHIPLTDVQSFSGPLKDAKISIQWCHNDLDP
jgi:hypothetical protein